MRDKKLTVALLLAAGLALAPGAAHAVSAAGAGSGHRAPVTPRPVAVYVGRQLVGSGQNVNGAVSAVRSQVPFAIRVPRYAPTGYVPVQLAVTPQQRDVSTGRATLSYALTNHGKADLTASNAFAIDQGATALAFVGGTRVAAATAGRYPATLHEFRTAGHDLLILTWVDGAGNGYDITTDAATSHLTPAIIGHIAASLS